MTHYESLAIDYANQALVLRAVATVHLENMNDEFFWKPILESIKPGTYNFIGTSKNKNDKETSGCAQCLNFKGYLSKSFFVCMDSDYRLLGNGELVSVNDFFAQTYTYSWENHLCFADDLQKRLTTALTGKTPYIAFDFKVFLSKLSEAVYPIVLQYNTIGTHICKNTHIPFEKKILKVMTASPSHYAEMDNLIQDVRHILL